MIQYVHLPVRITNRTTKEIVRDVEARFGKSIIKPSNDACSNDDECKCTLHYETNVQKKLDTILRNMGSVPCDYQ